MRTAFLVLLLPHVGSFQKRSVYNEFGLGAASCNVVDDSSLGRVFVPLGIPIPGEVIHTLITVPIVSPSIVNIYGVVPRF